MFSSTWLTTLTGCSNGFLLNIGIMVLNTDEGGGGLGVLARETGLVKPPSLVRSAVVTLLLLHMDAVDMPRAGLLSECSSTGELVLEPA